MCKILVALVCEACGEGFGFEGELHVRSVPFILNKAICGRGWILFQDEVECLPFVEAGDFCATGLLAEQPEEDFTVTVQNWRQHLD